MDIMKGIIFDFNGVLWWDTHLQEKAWKNFSKKLRGTPLNYEEIACHVHGRTNEHSIEYLLGQRVTNSQLHVYTQEKESFYRDLCLAEGDNFRLSPGAIPLLDYLKEENIPRTIATASESSNLHFFIRHFCLDRWFDIEKIVYDNGKIPGKPAPDMYLLSASHLSLEPKDCIVVEDSISGIEAANSAGIGEIIALSKKEKHPALLTQRYVHTVIEDLSQVTITGSKIA